jgi:hypothetical protein
MNPSENKLLFFVDPSWRREDIHHTPLLFPFWGNPPTPKMPFFHQLFERHSFDTSLYGITENEEQADAVLMPYGYATTVRSYPELFELCKEKADQLEKKLIVDGSGDIDWDIVGNVVVLRHGGYRFTKRATDITIPFYADDLLEAYCEGNLLFRSKPIVPAVGFSGWGVLTPRQEMRAVLKELPDRLRSIFDSRFGAKKKGVFYRRDAVSILEKSSKIKTNFLVRSSYSGHVDTAQKSPDVLRREFVNNLLSSDYCLDVRGDANNTIRLFEILSVGRIPVIVDTERNLPFSDRVNYASFSLIVDFRDLKRLPEIVSDFNAALSEEKFAAMQQNAREAFTHYFRVDAMTVPLVEEIRAKLSL